MTPYADAIRHAARRTRLCVPGHGGDTDSHPELTDFAGQNALVHDLPQLIEAVDLPSGGEPSGLQQAEEAAAAAWGSARTWFLTNGSTQGNHIATLALASIGRSLIVQRNSHSSVTDGMALAGIDPHYASPTIDTRYQIAHGLTPQQVQRAIEQHPDAIGVYIVSPTYYGAVSDVEGISRIVHDAGKILIVDEAWGAHFPFHDDLPHSSCTQGSDITITSLHKTGGSLSQSALLHLNEGPHRDRLEDLIQRAHTLTSSTSRNSLLLASLDIGRSALQDGKERIERTLTDLAVLRQSIERIPGIAELHATIKNTEGVRDADPLKIVLDARAAGHPGHSVQAHLEAHGILPELSTPQVALLVTGAMARVPSRRLLEALHTLPHAPAHPSPHDDPSPSRPGRRLTGLREAVLAEGIVVDAENAIGRASCESIAAYPPGIPTLLPGEEITEEAVRYLQHVVRTPHGYLRGGIDRQAQRFRVV